MRPICNQSFDKYTDDINSDSFQIKINQAIQLITSKANPYVIYLFGSAAKNKLRKDSDIDLAFLGDESIGVYECFLLSQELANIFGRDIDLINLGNASTVFKVQVIHGGRVILDNEAEKRMVFEMRTFKEYALLNEERQEILDNIRESGRVYE